MLLVIIVAMMFTVALKKLMYFAVVQETDSS